MSFHPDGIKIKRWREERHWSQEHLADLAGIGTRTLQRIENGGPASKDTVMALAAAFNVGVEALTYDPKIKASLDEKSKAEKALKALNLSFYIHMASYAFGMVVFLAISVSDAREGFIMLIPAAWWTVGVAGHALAVIIVTIVNQSEFDDLRN